MKRSYLTSNSFITKVVVIAAFVLLMLIPVKMVESLITERAENMTTVKEEITGTWGGKQELTGAMLVLPYDKKNKDGEVTGVENAYFLPDVLDIDGEVSPDKRSRGIYKILCYQSDLDVKGYFSFPDYAKLGIKSEQIHWDKAYVSIGVSYMQGIKNKIQFRMNGTPYEITPPDNANGSGFIVRIPFDETNRKEKYNFNYNLLLNGTEDLSFVPVGKQTAVHIRSKWETVSFTGEFLPSTRKIAQDSVGFDAQWNVYDYNRNYPQQWKGKNDNLLSSALGVSLLQPVDQYQMTMRSIKYAILFIALTFVVFLLIEIISHKRIHPVQYLLVSFALVLFYCLLLSFSEQIGFGLAYLISSSATIILITAYARSIFGEIKLTVLTTAFLTALYVFLYVLLQLSEMSLLFGSIGLFITLAIIMYVTKKIDWYKNEESHNSTLIISQNKVNE